MNPHLSHALAISRILDMQRQADTRRRTSAPRRVLRAA
jgi:hypothetical protein